MLGDANARKRHSNQPLRSQKAEALPRWRSNADAAS